MQTTRLLTTGLVLAGALFCTACQSDNKMSSKDAAPAAKKMADYNRPGFYTKVDDGRLWVFRADSKELAEFMKSGEPAKQVTRIGGGPNGMTIKSVDTETIDAYMAAK